MVVDQKQHQEIERLVRRAGGHLRTRWPNDPQRRADLVVNTKPDGSKVSNADLESHQLLITGLSALFPGTPLLSEEGAIGDLSYAPSLWLIDPLDGTHSFIEGGDDFSVLVAQVEDGHVPYCVMYFPIREQFAWAQQGRGAFLNGERMRVSSVTTLTPGAINVRHCTLLDEKIAMPFWLDSGLAILKLCVGEIAGFVIKLTQHGPWDLAPAVALVEQSGGRVSDEHGAPITLTNGRFTCQYFIGSNGHVHDELLKLLPVTVA